jgi:hypothetical protein
VLWPKRSKQKPGPARIAEGPFISCVALHAVWPRSLLGDMLPFLSAATGIM